VCVIVQVQVVAEALRGGAQLSHATLGASVSTDCTIFMRDHLTPFFAYPARHSQGDLHHQCGGVAEHELAQGGQDARLVSQR
jgi:hypothetical protein